MEMTHTFSNDEISLQVDRILEFTAFKNSPTLSRFFRFIISETIEERNVQIKEYSIAIHVLNRSTDFNPQDDAVVRIHAGRLRRALNEYYFTKGISDTIIIDIPKGGYVPNFQHSKNELLVQQNLPGSVFVTYVNPVVAVFPFKILPEGKEQKEFANRFGELLSGELSRFRDLTVIGYYSDCVALKIEQNVLEAGKMVMADYILCGNMVVEEKKLHIRLNLLVVSTGEVLMTRSFIKNTGILQNVESDEHIIFEVTAALGGYSGLLFRALDTASPCKAGRHLKVREAIFKYYKYHRYFSVENYQDAFRALQKSLQEDPDNAVTHAMLGELYVGGMAINVFNSDHPLDDARQRIHRSLGLDPLCQHAWYAETLFHLFNKNREECLKSANRCISLNPNNHAMVGGVGFMLVCTGYMDEGYSLMEKSTSNNAFYPWWLNGGFCFYHLLKGEYEHAYRWAEKLHCEQIFWDPLLKCVCLAYQEKLCEAKKYLGKLRALEPDLSGNLHQMLSTFLISRDLVLHIIVGLKKAGYP